MDAEIYKNQKNAEKILPATVGHYKSIIASKQEENGLLKENRDWLVVIVSSIGQKKFYEELNNTPHP